MDNQAEFRRFLHQMAKKDHVIEGLIQTCERFENYLQGQGAKVLDQASNDDLDNFVADLGQHGQDPKNALRGLAIYYKFSRLYYDAGLDRLEKLASSDPDRLRPHLVKFVERTHFDGIASLPKELHFTVRRAQELEKIVESD